MANKDECYFTEGTEVEISSEEDGFRGSWYAATVVTPPPSATGTTRTRKVSGADRSEKVTIEYRDLMEDGRSKKRLRETIDVVQIRPIPPREAKVDFKFNDLVDALFNDGWWEGVIVKVLEGGRFQVYFRATKELIEFGEESLRIHREWVHGHWIPPLLGEEKDEPASASDKPPKAKHVKPSEVSLSLDKPSEAFPVHDKSSKASPAPGKTSKAMQEKSSKASPRRIKSSKASPAHHKPSRATAASEKQSKASPALDKPSEKSPVLSKPSKATVTHEKPSKSVAAHDKPAGKENFVKGLVVEVKSDEDGFQGAWYSATIIKVLSKDKFLVEYKYLKTEDDSEFCKEEVDILHIRPAPPEIIKVDSYSMYEEVDALYNDGWWAGVISKVYTGSRYLVFFRGTNEELEFDHADLRVHQEWIDGQWIVPFLGLKP
uniref:Agenet domain-containing protein n=1 Tax=Kalanchoe fedtschenkoi TaxID=63787 RepID=A0A7N0TEF5_KALFE